VSARQCAPGAPRPTRVKCPRRRAVELGVARCPRTSLASTVTPFARAFSSVASIDGSSIVDATTGAKPSSAAAIDRTPDPQPTSSSGPGSSYCTSGAELLVWCDPVPKARPGSTTRPARPSAASPRRTDPEPPDTDWTMERAHLSSQPVSTSALRPLRRTPRGAPPGCVGVRSDLGALHLVRPPRSLAEEASIMVPAPPEAFEAHLDRDPAQFRSVWRRSAERALQLWSKKLSSFARSCSHHSLPEVLEQAARSSVTWRGTEMLTAHGGRRARSPAAPAMPFEYPSRAGVPGVSRPWRNRTRHPSPTATGSRAEGIESRELERRSSLPFTTAAHQGLGEGPGGSPRRPRRRRVLPRARQARSALVRQRANDCLSPGST